MASNTLLGEDDVPLSKRVKRHFRDEKVDKSLLLFNFLIIFLQQCHQNEDLPNVPLVVTDSNVHFAVFRMLWKTS